MHPTPTILLGCRRSGTTMLRKILAQHPDIISPPHEPQFILELYKRFGRNIKNKEAAFNFVTSHRYILEPIDKTKLKSIYIEQCDNASKSLIQLLFNEWCSHFDGKLLVIKHPELSYHISIIQDVFPNAQYINLVRDPRANISSQLSRWNNDSVWRCIRLWKQALNNLDKLENTIGQDQYVELKYENLLLYREETLTELCHKINIPYNPIMLDFKSPARRWSPGGKETKVDLQSVDKSRLDIWKSNLPTKKIYQIETCCKSEMKYYDYQKSKENNSAIHAFVTLLTYESLKSANYFIQKVKDKIILITNHYKH